MTEMTVYLFILKSISGPNFNNLYKLWILWSCIGLGIFVKEKKVQIKERNKSQLDTGHRQ